MASVAHLFRAVKRGLPMVELSEAELIAGFGVAGCSHGKARGGERQVLLVDSETLAAMNLPPGALRENVTTTGLNVNGLSIGARLRLGRTLLEVSLVCTPCSLMERIRPGLRKELWGRRGMLCRVIEGGLIRQGDAIQRVSSGANTDESAA